MNWYAIHARYQYEPRIQATLAESGVECFWPSVSRVIKNPLVKNWQKRTRTIQVSVLPGYVFAHFDPQEMIVIPRAEYGKPGEPHRMSILDVPGVVGVVGYGKPEPIPETEVTSLRMLIDSGLPLCRPEYDPKPGDLVEITVGSWAGYIGFISIKRGDHPDERLFTVNIETLKMSVSAVVPASWLKPPPPPKPSHPAGAMSAGGARTSK